MEKNTKKAKKLRKNFVKNAREGRNGGKLNNGVPKEKNLGRPPGIVNWKTLYNQLLTLPAPDQLLAEIKKVNPDAKLIQDIVVINTFNRALKGNPKAMELLHYYAGDKPKDTVEHTGNVEVDLYQNLTKEELKKELDKLGLSDKLFDR